MAKIKAFWKKFKEQPDIWFFIGFLLTSTLSVRKVFHFFQIQGSFNEYSNISLYISDLFLISTIITWIAVILYNEYTTLSNKSCSSGQQVSNFYSFLVGEIKCSTCLPDRQAWNILSDKLSLIPLGLVAWSFLSIIWSKNHVLSLYQSIKLFEFFILYLYIRLKLFGAYRIVPRGTISETTPGQSSGHTSVPQWNILRPVIRMIIAIGLFQALIGIFQIIVEHSLGLFVLKESLIGPDIPGVAKILINSQKVIRAYGLFPHPNILGGFLLFSILLTHLHRKLFHVEQLEGKKLNNVPRLSASWRDGTFEYLKIGFSAWTSSNWFFWSILAIQIIGLILTISKSAVLGLFLALVYLFINHQKIVPRGTIGENRKMFHVEHLSDLKRYFIISLIIFGFLLFYFKIDLYSLFWKSLSERMLYLTASVRAISEHMFLGIGQGQFVLEMGKYLPHLETWQFQPVHNVFLLVLSELGMVGLFFFIWFLLEIFRNEEIVPSRQEADRRGTISSFSRLEQSDPKNMNSELSLKFESDPRLATNQEMGNQECSTWNIYMRAILLGFVFIMLFDHYLWDIQQGSLMFWMLLAFVAGKR